MVILDGKKAFTMKETADLLQFDYNTVRKLVSSGKLPALIISEKKHVTEDTIREYTQQKGGQKHE